MIVGYIRVSKIQQDLKTQKNALLNFCHSRKLIIDKFIEVEVSSRKSKFERKLDQLEDFNRGDVLIVSELSRLGRSLSEVLEIVSFLINRGVQFICIKENIDLHTKHSMQSKVMITMFGLFAELERDLISQRTKEALATKVAQGIKLGRPVGPGKSKLDQYQNQIVEFLDKKVSILSISKILNISYPSLFNYIKKHNLKNATSENQQINTNIIPKTGLIVAPTKKTIRVKLSIYIENNTKYVRGKKRAIQDIEFWVLPEYDANFKKLGNDEYRMNIEYSSKKNLDDRMYALLQEVSLRANDRHCYSDGTTIKALDEEDKYWG